MLRSEKEMQMQALLDFGSEQHVTSIQAANGQGRAIGHMVSDETLAEYRQYLPDSASGILVRTDEIVGEYAFADSAPDVLVVENAIYVPLGSPAIDTDYDWGCYTTKGSLIASASYWRGPGRLRVGQSDLLTLQAMPSAKINDVMIYAGMTHTQFGHFLMGVLPRFWCDLRSRFPDAKILMHSANFELWKSLTFVADILNAIDISFEDIVTLDEPTIIGTLIVPSPAMVEQSHVTQAMKPFATQVGRILEGQTRSKRAEPIYLSKEHVSSGIWTCKNESAFAERLEKAGVRIFHPQRHPISEQVAEMNRHQSIIGLQSSALHTLMFCDAKKRVKTITPVNALPSNFLIIDHLKENSSIYAHPIGGMTTSGSATTHFHIEYAFENPVASAEDILRLVEA